MTFEITLPNINGVLEVGLAAGTEAALADAEQLRVKPGTTIMLTVASAAEWAATNISLEAAACAAVCIKYGLIRAVNNVPDGDWVVDNNAHKLTEEHKKAIEGKMASLPPDLVISMVVAAKVNWWATNHHVGTNEFSSGGSGYFRKVLDQKKDITRMSPSAMAKLFHMVSHWCSTKFVLQLGGIQGLVATNYVTTDVPDEFKMAADITIRLTAPPAGTHRLAIASAIFKRMVKNKIAAYCPGVLDMVHLAADLKGVMDSPAKHHIGATYLTGHARADFNDTMYETYLGRLGSYIRVMAPRSTLASSPHITEARVHSYEDYSNDWDRLCRDMRGAQSIPNVVPDDLPAADVANIRARLREALN